MDDRLALALKYYQSNLDDQAWSLVADLLEEPDPSLDVVSLAATLTFERGDWDQAIAFCDRILNSAPNDAHTLLIKDRALPETGNHADAVGILQSAVDANPDLAAAHYNLGWVRQTLGNHEGAIAAYRAATDRQDPYPVAWNNLGLVLERAGDGESAVAAFRTAIKQAPGFSAAHNNLGAMLASGGHYAAATEAYAQALPAGTI